jgi:tetratricopeptide (TPR) repeat protein
MNWWTRRLIRRGFKHIAQGKFDAALAVGEKLKRSIAGAGYEIVAQAQAGKSDRPAAIKTLHAGTQAYPDAWRLWELLGNYHSDAGHFAEAQTAYDRALRCTDVDRGFVQINIAIAFERDGKLERAFEELARVPPDHPELTTALPGVRMRILNELAKHSEALAVAEATHFDLTSWPEANASRFLLEKATALWRGKRDATAALDLAIRAQELDGDREGCLALIREIEGRQSQSPRCFRLLVSGKWLRGDLGEPMDFFRNFEVIAESVAQALDYVRRFEPPEVRDHLSIERSDAAEAQPEALHGVYWLSGHIFFRPE